MAGTTFSTSNWQYYAEHSADISPGGALTDFTNMIDIAEIHADDSSFGSNVQSDGGDIRCTDEDDNELPFDLVDWAYNSGSPTGQIYPKRSLATSDSTQKVRVWFGYTPGTAVAYDANETYGSDNAYDSTFVAVYPLAVDGNDRTANGNDLTANGGLSYGGVSGHFGNATDFDSASSQYASITDKLIGIHPVSAFAWTYDDATQWNGVFQAEMAFQEDLYALTTRAGIGARATYSEGYSNTDFDAGSISNSTWYAVSVDFVGSSSRTVFVDGTAGTENTTTRNDHLASSADEHTWVGRTNAGYRNGRIHSLSFHSNVRSSAWKDHKFSQEDDNATFWGTWSVTDTGGGGGPTIKQTLSRIDFGEVAGLHAIGAGV